MSSSKNPEIENTSFLTKSNSSFIENMYLRYIEKDKTLPVSWQSYFKSLDEEQSLVIEETIKSNLPFVEYLFSFFV